MNEFFVIGAGINGLLLARELAHGGARVSLMDQQRPGMESSWAGGGIVSPLYPWRYGKAVTALATLAQDFYPGLAQGIFQETGINPELIQTGLLMLDAVDEPQALAWARQFDQKMIRLSSAEFYAREQGLGQGFQSALSMPTVANIRNPRLCQGLVASLRMNPNVKLLDNSKLEQLVVTKGAISHLKLAGHRGSFAVGGAKVVLCTGAWTATLLHNLGLYVDINPVKGQMLLYKFPQPPTRSILLTDGRYLIPRVDGHLLVGSTLENTGFNKAITNEARESLRDSAHRILPELRDHQPIAQWAGLRPGTSDGVPVIGAVPIMNNLFVNAGQHRNGLVLAPASARLMADLLLGREPLIDPEPYDPQRRIELR